MHFVIRYHTGLDPEQAARRAMEYLLEQGYSRQSPAEPFVRNGASGLLVFPGARKNTTAWLIPEPSAILGSTIRLEMEVAADSPLFLRKDRELLFKEIAGIGESLLTEDYQGSCSPWPLSTYVNLPMIVLSVMGLLLGIVTATVLHMQILAGFVFSLAATSSLTGVGLKLERKRQLALEEREKIRQNYMAANEQSQPKQADKTEQIATRLSDREAMELEALLKRELRLWAICCGLLSIPAVVSTRLESFWGLALVAVAIMFAIFPAPAMLVVSGVILLWAGISTAFGGGIPAWILAGAFIILGWRILRSYRRFAPVWTYYQVNLNYPGLPQPSNAMLRASVEFPWLSALLSILGAVVGFGLLAFAFVQGSAFGNGPYGLLKTFALDFAIGLGMIGFAMGLSALLSNYKQMLLSILTMIVSIVVILEWVGYLMISVIP